MRYHKSNLRINEKYKSNLCTRWLRMWRDEIDGSVKNWLIDVQNQEAWREWREAWPFKVTMPPANAHVCISSLIAQL